MKRKLIAILVAAALAGPAAVLAQSTSKDTGMTKDRPAASSSTSTKSDTTVRTDAKGSKSPDSVITGKIKSGFVKDKIVRSRNYNVDTAGGVVTVKGRARTQAEADRAIEIAKNTSGVVSVKNEVVVAATSADKPAKERTSSTSKDRTSSTSKQRSTTSTERAADTGKPQSPAASASGQKTESTAADMPAKGDAKAKASTSASTSTSTSKDSSPDALITTKIKAEHAKDKDVSATKIHVDTNNGVVTLTGTAKSKAEADKAVALAKGVKDVKSVKNEIKIEAK